MRFEELLHWNDGQFLQPHHFQYLQRVNSDYIRLNRRFSLSYPYGLIDFELETDALSGVRVSVKRLSAVMSDGLELSMPGNCTLSPLDLSAALEENPNEITVYLAVPHWSEYEANLAEGTGNAGKRLFLSQKRRVREENSGDNEIALITRKINARLVTNFDNSTDMQTLPILKLNVTSHGVTEGAVALNEKYIPPFMMLSADCPLLNMVNNLLADMRRCRDKAIDTLTAERFGPEQFTGTNAYTALRLRTLNLYDIRLVSLLVPGQRSPFDLYLELASLLAELMSFDPVNSIREIRRYAHEDLGPVFTELLKDIRSFILASGGVGYIKLDFSLIDGGYLFAPIRTEDISSVQEAYLAVYAEAEERTVIKALEAGDTFKLISPGSKNVRARGIKLGETPYPPRFLPVLRGTIWFRLELDESARVWREVCEERGMLIDYAAGLFPGLEAALYVVQVG
jgi:type VI secretion system ImpJ/VasE family protein